MMTPLEGIRVLDVTHAMPGAIASMLMADYGADVIQVLPGPPSTAPAGDVTQTWNRGKRRVELDLADPLDGAALRRLVADADVVLIDLDAAERTRFELQPADISAANPDVVQTVITGFGLDDARATPAFEALVAAELGAMITVPGIHRDGPVFLGHPAVTYSTAFVALIGTLAAVRARVVSGRGDVVDASLLDGVLAQFTMNWWTERKVSFLSSRRADGQLDLGATRMLVRRYRCNDGKLIQVHTGAAGAFGRLMALLGLDDEISEAVGAVESASLLNARDQEILEDLPALFATRSSEEWLRDIWANEIAALPVLAPGEVFTDEQVIHNGLVRDVNDPELGHIRVVAPPIHLSATPARQTDPQPVVPGATIAWEAPGLGPGGDEMLLAGPLDGINVVELATFFAAPYANRFLRDLGARVIKVEPVSGDPMRSLPDPFAGVAKGKESIALDLKAEESRPVIDELLRTADVVQHNFRPGVAERLRVDYASVRAMNPAVVYGYAPGYGSSGPKSMLQSFAPLHSGFVGLHVEAAGEGNDPVACFGNEDYYNGQLNAVATLLALIHRERTGDGQYVECPQLNSAVFVTSHWYRLGTELRSSLPLLDHDQYGWSPYQRLYQALEGWICVFCTDTSEQDALRRIVLGRDGDDGNADSGISESLRYEFFSRSASEWVALLRAEGVPCTEARENSWLHDFLQDEANAKSGRATPFVHADHGAVSVIGRIVRLQSHTAVEDTQAPTLGQHSREILARVGVTSGQAEEMVASGVVVAAGGASHGEQDRE